MARQRVLNLQLTDEADAYLLYSLHLSEDDFHALKTEQVPRAACKSAASAAPAPRAAKHPVPYIAIASHSLIIFIPTSQ